LHVVFSQKHKLSFFIIISLSFFTNGFSQSFFRLSKAEKFWVIQHPFAAMKAHRVSKWVLIQTDSLNKTNVLDTFNSGGTLDAFRHILWMYALAKRIGEPKARALGRAHEKGNYQQFVKRQLEENTRPDSLSSVMDLYNNEIGLNLYKMKSLSMVKILPIIIQSIKNGEALIIKRTETQFKDCAGNEIDLNFYQTKWYVPYCLIKSNGLTD
jgi:hypothetical protein